ncbi:hypothetical protein PG993_013759 [Apiospora rasikravindrae]|uniref:Uncharacterized protein n=1 Tax=Apiospora rasikravindrae TaxID=990691 RepID=A0ABR1RT64_9PEZI
MRIPQPCGQFDGLEVMGNDGAREIIRQMVTPAWLENMLQTKFSAGLRARLGNDPERLLDMVTDWARKWAGVRHRYLTHYTEAMPRAHVWGSDFHINNTAKRNWQRDRKTLMNGINRGLIHAPDIEGDAFLNLTDWWPTQDNGLFERSTGQTGQLAQDPRNWGYFLTYQSSAEEIMRLRSVREGLEGKRPALHAYFVWIRDYINVCAHFQVVLADAFNYSTSRYAPRGTPQYEAFSRGYEEGVEKYLRRYRRFLRRVREACVRAGLYNNDGSRLAANVNWATVRLYREDVWAIRNAVTLHNQACGAFDIVTTLLQQGRDDLYPDIAKMTSVFPGSLTMLPPALREPDVIVPREGMGQRPPLPANFVAVLANEVGGVWQPKEDGTNNGDGDSDDDDDDNGGTGGNGGGQNNQNNRGGRGGGAGRGGRGGNRGGNNNRQRTFGNLGNQTTFEWPDSPVNTLEHLELLFDKFFSMVTPATPGTAANVADSPTNTGSVPTPPTFVSPGGASSSSGSALSPPFPATPAQNNQRPGTTGELLTTPSTFSRVMRTDSGDGKAITTVTTLEAPFGSVFETPTRQPSTQSTGDVFTTSPTRRPPTTPGNELGTLQEDVDMVGATTTATDADPLPQVLLPSPELEELCRNISELGRKAGVVESDEARYQRLTRVQLTLQLMGLEVAEQVQTLYKDLYAQEPLEMLHGMEIESIYQMRPLVTDGLEDAGGEDVDMSGLERLGLNDPS